HLPDSLPSRPASRSSCDPACPHPLSLQIRHQEYSGLQKAPRKSAKNQKKTAGTGPAASFKHAACSGQNLYFRLIIIDQRDTAVLPLSLLFSWICALSVEPLKL